MEDYEKQYQEGHRTSLTLGAVALAGALFGMTVSHIIHNTIQTENVIAGNAPEKFYEIAGKRVYLEIDGQPVDVYVRNRK